MGKNKLNFSNLAWLGFDLDHTLVRYHIENLQNLVHESLIEGLVEIGYPEELKKATPKRVLMKKGIVIDKVRGNFIKVDQNQQIEKAYHGSNLLSTEEIEKQYAQLSTSSLSISPTNSSTSVTPGIHKTLSSESVSLSRVTITLGSELNSTDRFWTMFTYFEIPVTSVFSHLVDLYDTGKIPKKDIGSESNPSPIIGEYYSLWKDLTKSIHSTFASTEANYYQKFSQRMSEVLYPFDPKIREWLESLKEKGVKLFLVTNSYPGYSDILLQHLLEDKTNENCKSWKDLFEFCFFSSRKPDFWNRPDKSANKILSLNDGKAVLSSEQTFSHVKQGGMYSGGNVFMIEESKIFKEHIEQFLKKNPRYAENNPDPVPCCYVGDHLLYDVTLPRKRGWSSVSIVEELDELYVHRKIENYSQFLRIDGRTNSDYGYNDPVWGNFWFSLPPQDSIIVSPRSLSPNYVPKHPKNLNKENQEFHSYFGYTLIRNSTLLVPSIQYLSSKKSDHEHSFDTETFAIE